MRSPIPGISRREAIRILGAGAALGAFSGRLDAGGAPHPPASPQQRKAIVRTILEDVAPERLSGTTLIHEHLSSSAAFTDDVVLIADEVKACAQDGVTCIVDAGTN